VGRFFGLDDAEQHRIAKQWGERVAPLVDGSARWDGSDEQVIVSGKFAGYPVRVRLDATFGTLWFELKLEPQFPRLGQFHLVQDSDGKKEQPETPPDDDFEDPTRRDDFKYFVSDTVHAGDGAPDAAFTIDLLERFPVELKEELLVALEPDHSHVNIYFKEIQLRCGGEPLGEDDVLEVVQRYLSLCVKLNVALRAIWRLA
jgi:hypothetical protein